MKKTMTDYETLKALLTKWGVEFTEAENGGDSGDHTITVERGYPGFVTTYTFHLDGSFKDTGAYE